MRKTIKRLGAVLLAMAMAVSVLCTGALAAGSTYTLTIRDSNQNHKYTAYQVFAGTVQDTTEGKKHLNVTGWGDGVDLTSKSTEGTYNDKTLGQAIQAIEISGAKPFEGKTEPGDIAAVLGAATDNAVATAFADVVANYVTGDGHSTTNWKAAADNTPAHYEITGLTGGYYFVKSANTASTDVANTRYMLEVVGNATVEAKNGVPTVDKKVQNADNTDKNFADTTTAQIGQTVNFKLTGTLPSNYDYYKNYAYTFDDTLSEGLTLTEKQKNELFVKVYASQNEAAQDKDGSSDSIGTKLTAKSGGTGNYTVTVASPSNDTKTTSLKVAFDDLKTINKDNNALITKNSVIVVYYSATINGSATVGGAGNKNSVKLEYSNDPNNTGTGTTKSDEVSVFTFKLDITKIKKGDENTRLSGAKFVLSTSADLKMDVTESDANLSENVKNNLIKVTGTTPNYVINDGTNTSANEQYIMETASDGKLNITGLNKGVYYLYETKAPEGYNRITEPIKIEITEATTEKNANGTFSVKTLKYTIGNGTEQTVENATTGTISATVENTSGSTLPSTGGMGTKLFYTIGGILMAGAAIVLVVRKRRSDAE